LGVRLRSPVRFYRACANLGAEHIVDDIACPVLVCDADDDAFFKGQAAALAKALGPRVTYKLFTNEDSASAHYHVGASDLLNSTVLGWIEETLSVR
jgi:hypothetical protein